MTPPYRINDPELSRAVTDLLVEDLEAIFATGPDRFKVTKGGITPSNGLVTIFMANTNGSLDALLGLKRYKAQKPKKYIKLEVSLCIRSETNDCSFEFAQKYDGIPHIKCQVSYGADSRHIWKPYNARVICEGVYCALDINNCTKVLAEKVKNTINEFTECKGKIGTH